MKLHVIETGRFRLDGGAMFGVVPKALWSRTNLPDDQNRIHMAMRCLLVELPNRLILIDCGIGQKVDDKFRQIYALDEGHSTLETSLARAGFGPQDITDLVLTHLHFDHCGGATRFGANGSVQLVFPQAQIWLQRQHLAWAIQPNPREKASFLPINIEPLQAAPNLNLLDGPTELAPGFRLEVVNGHTEAQQLPLLDLGDRRLLFAADLFPTAGHLPLPYVMGYDTRPLLTLDERQHWLPRLADERVALFYEHDPENEVGFVRRTAKGFATDDRYTLAAYLAGPPAGKPGA